MECSNCGFPIRSDNKIGVCTRPSCITAYHNARYQLNPENGQKKAKKWRTENPYKQTERKYGLEPGQYLELLEEQNGLCYICGKSSEDNGRALAVDHDHTCCPGSSSCGRCVRGLLCHRCNRVLGMLDDDPELMMAMAEYVTAR